MKKRSLFTFGILFSIGVLSLLGPVSGLVRHNYYSLAWIHDNISLSVALHADELDRQCALAGERYAAGDYQQVVDLMFEKWTSATEVVLRMSLCRNTALDLAASLEQLDRQVDAEQVYRRIIEINPGSRDWVMHFAQLGVGNAEMQAGDIQAAMDSFVIAYDSTLTLPPNVEAPYEERAWWHFESLADALDKAGTLLDTLQKVQAKVAVDSSDPGWVVLVGILLERNSLCEEALTYYQAAQQQNPAAQFLKEHILNMKTGKAACQP